MALPFTMPALPWKWIGVGLLALGLIFAVIMYGDAKYDAGKTETDNAWKAAAKKLEAESQGAADAADKPADIRADDFAKKLEKEKRLVEEAIARGDSPLDAMFGVREQGDDPSASRPVAP